VRVLVAHSFYRVVGGEDRYVRKQVELLRPDHVVRLEAHDNSDLTMGLGALTRLTYSAGGRRRLARVLRDFRPDVVHLHNPYPSLGPAVHLAAADARVPLVQTVHNYRQRCPNGAMFTQARPCRRCEGGRYDNAVFHACFPSRTQGAAYASALWVHRFALKLDERVHTFVAPSEYMRGRLVEWGFPSDRIALVRNFTPIPDDAPDLGVSGLYLGRLSAEKGVDVLLRALARLGDPPFVIAGAGPGATSLRALATDLGLRRARFLGGLDDAGVATALVNARYVVVPSVWDVPAGLAALEAMARGRPIVASAVGGLPELAEGGRGRQSEPGSAESLAAAIAGYLDDPVACAVDGARAREFAARECTPQRHLEGLLAAYGQAGRIAGR